MNFFYADPSAWANRYATELGMPLIDLLLDQSIQHILTHNLNSTDAVHLASALEAHQLAQAKGHAVVLVSADQRLLRASAAGGAAAAGFDSGGVS
jgi:predicted nucleic acid-binding protein